MGNYSSALYAEVEDFKAIVSSPENATPDRHALEDSTLNNHVSGAEEPAVWNKLDISVLKFLHSFPEPCRENTEPDVAAVAASSAGSSGSRAKPKLKPHGPATLERLRDEIQDMRGELEVLKSQHKKDLKLMMTELDEEKKMRLSLEVEVNRLKKHMSK
ncbi:uncharacterized protein si:dkey-71d15.2 [Colossoma macropomum]|uniref:uncharacterized protein si:dkey-71d15.2 n=1 Tax=Colossoma macropomum TaxID=42526 RepID=UPI00186447CF|nr:uncharacterized protein si:dkey-71d15.2 [Colossoma macropomum]XP_036445018.1 uncharacterized protein si:dkey-71d15.2 [Colossoma macropomum]XP_036445019.1 uncharacterized protein si:dkey-71d15.2 [Colossoma macropomum]